MIRDTKRLRYSFTNEQKALMVQICNKFPHYDVIQYIKESVALDGTTVLTVGDALILAGLIQDYDESIATKLKEHPSIIEDQGIPQHFAQFPEDSPQLLAVRILKKRHQCICQSAPYVGPHHDKGCPRYVSDKQCACGAGNPDVCGPHHSRSCEFYMGA